MPHIVFMLSHFDWRGAFARYWWFMLLALVLAQCAIGLLAPARSRNGVASTFPLRLWPLMIAAFQFFSMIASSILYVLLQSLFTYRLGIDPLGLTFIVVLVGYATARLERRFLAGRPNPNPLWAIHSAAVLVSFASLYLYLYLSSPTHLRGI